MKSFFSYAALAFAALLYTGCNDERDSVQKQKENINSYISSRLTATEDNYIVKDGLYRYLADNKLEEWDIVEIDEGDVLYIDFAIYTFSTTPSARPFYTNYRELAGEGVQIPASPMRVKLGDGQILKPIEKALPDYVRGDSLLFFVTSDLAYGKKNNGLVQPNTAIQYNIMIVDVEKNR